MLTCCNNSNFQWLQLMANMRKYHPKLFNLFNVANNNINSTFKLKRKPYWFLWCGNEIQVLPRIFFLKTSTLNAVTPKVTELNNRKYQNKTSCISSQRKIMKPMNSRKRKSFKKLQVQTRVRNYFSFKFSTLNRGVWNVREKRWGKQSYLATSRENLREAHTILACCFTDSLCSHVYTPIDQWCLNAKLFTVVSSNFGSFSQTEIISHPQ